MKLNVDDIGRHVFLALGGCALAVVSMGVYSLLLFASTGVFLLLVCSLSPAHVHPWVFGVQMSWQTLWHLYMQYREYYLNETTHVRYYSSCHIDGAIFAWKYIYFGLYLISFPSYIVIPLVFVQ